MESVGRLTWCTALRCNTAPGTLRHIRFCPWILRSDHPMDYPEAWSYLDQLQFFKIKLGLDSMNRFLGLLGDPHQQVPCVHIGGTNGKGSVAATLHSILDRAGFRVGLYTSPHLSSVRERFRINKTFISRDDFTRLTQEIRHVLGRDQITYFEFTTTMAMLWFAEQGVDLALLEVGMGGRLDATNVVTPLVSVITNVSMDHEQYLGETLEQVAKEKAGIIKPGVPVVSGVADDIGRTVIESRCDQLASPLHLLGRDFHGRTVQGSGTWEYTGLRHVHRDLPLAMRGGYQVANASLALATLELLADHGLEVTGPAIRHGLAATRWPGRLESFEIVNGNQWRRRFLLDGAHNPAGVQALGNALQGEFSFARLILVWAAMADKDIRASLAAVAPLAHRIIFTRPETERSARPEDLRALLPAAQRPSAHCTDSVDQALQLAMEAAARDDLICVAGSLYLVGKARQILLGDLVDTP